MHALTLHMQTHGKHINAHIRTAHTHITSHHTHTHTHSTHTLHTHTSHTHMHTQITQSSLEEIQNAVNQSVRCVLEIEQNIPLWTSISPPSTKSVQCVSLLLSKSTSRSGTSHSPSEKTCTLLPVGCGHLALRSRPLCFWGRSRLVMDRHLYSLDWSGLGSVCLDCADQTGTYNQQISPKLWYITSRSV